MAHKLALGDSVEVNCLRTFWNLKCLEIMKGQSDNDTTRGKFLT